MLSRFRKRRLRDYMSNKFEQLVTPGNGFFEKDQLLDEDDVGMDSLVRGEEASTRKRRPQSPQHLRLTEYKKRREANAYLEQDQLADERDMDMIVNASRCNSSTTKQELEALLKKLIIPHETLDILKRSLRNIVDANLSELAETILELTAERNESKEEIKKLLRENEEIQKGSSNAKRFAQDDKDVNEKVAEITAENEKYRQELTMKNNAYGFLQKELMKTIIEKDEAREEVFLLKEQIASINSDEVVVQSNTEQFEALRAKHEDFIMRYKYEKEQANQYVSKLNHQAKQYYDHWVQLKGAHTELEKRLHEASSMCRQQYDGFSIERSNLVQKLNSYAIEIDNNRKQIIVLTDERNKQKQINREIASILITYGIRCGTRLEVESDLQRLTMRSFINGMDARIDNDSPNIDRTQSAVTGSNSVDTSDTNSYRTESVRNHNDGIVSKDVVERSAAKEGASETSIRNGSNIDTVGDTVTMRSSINGIDAKIDNDAPNIDRTKSAVTGSNTKDTSATNLDHTESVRNDNDSIVARDVVERSASKEGASEPSIRNGSNIESVGENVDDMGRQIIVFLEKDLNALIKNAENASDSMQSKETSERRFNNTENNSRAKKIDMRHVAKNRGGKSFYSLAKLFAS